MITRQAECFCAPCPARPRRESNPPAELVDRLIGADDEDIAAELVERDAMFRSLSMSMGLLLPVLFLISPLSMEFSGLRDVAQVLPDRAGQFAAMSVQTDPNIVYAPSCGLAIMAVWAVTAAVGGWQVLQRSDA